MTEIKNKDDYALEIETLVFRICFELRYSDFGFSLSYPPAPVGKESFLSVF